MDEEEEEQAEARLDNFLQKLDEMAKEKRMKMAYQEKYDPKIDSMGFSKRRLLSYEDSLDYGYVSQNCEYQPKQHCKQVHITR